MEMKGSNIDNLFKEKLFEQEVSPPEEVWSNISKQIHSKKSKKLIVLWYRIAAGVTIFLASAWFITKVVNKSEGDTTTITKNEQVHKEEITNKSNKNTPVKPQSEIKKSENNEITEQEIIASGDIANEDPNNNKNWVAQNHKETITERILPVNNEEQQINTGTGSRTETLISEGVITEENSLEKLALKDIVFSIEIPKEQIKYEKSEVYAVNIKPAKDNQWEVGGYYAPLYSYRAVETGESDMTSSMMSNAEEGQYTYSGGFSVNYKISNRLSIGTGLSVVNHSYKISNIATLGSYNNLSYFADAAVASKSNQTYSVNNSIGQIAPSGDLKIYSNSRTNYDSFVANESQTAINNSYVLPDDRIINQSFDYMEVPILLRFKIIDRNLGLHLVSGLSSYFLINNKVTIKSPDQPDLTGETLDIKSTNLSGSLGLGLNYSLSKSLKLNMEPLFKVFLNSINTSNSVDAYPYTFGIYSGVYYSF